MCPHDLDGAIVSFLNYGTGNAIDLNQGNGGDGTPIIGYRFHGGQNQQWKLIKVGDNPVWPTWMIRNVQSGTYIDLYNGDSGNGAGINGWQGGNNGNPHQLWHLISGDPSGRVFMIQNAGTATFLDLGDSQDLTPLKGWAGKTESKNPHQLWRIVRMQ